MFYEDENASFFGAKQKFLNIRKRAYRFDKPKKAQMVAIPTTSGTGSEVTPFAVITDAKTHVKYPLADYALTPDVAIVDPSLWTRYQRATSPLPVWTSCATRLNPTFPAWPPITPGRCPCKPSS